MVLGFGNHRDRFFARIKAGAKTIIKKHLKVPQINIHVEHSSRPFDAGNFKRKAIIVVTKEKVPWEVAAAIGSDLRTCLAGALYNREAARSCRISFLIKPRGAKVSPV